MIQPVLKKGEPLLRQRSKEVEDISQVDGLITDLWDTLAAIKKTYDFRRGIGIAAPQIGQPLRVNVVDFADEQHTLINPIIVEHSEEKIAVREGCLSFFEFRGMALRHAEVTVAALDTAGRSFTIDASGDFSSLLQHELDHLDGILYDSVLAPGEDLFQPPNIPKIP